MKIKYPAAGRFTTVAAIFFILYGCGVTICEWKDQSYRKKPGNILIAARVNPIDARLIENELARRLEATGVDAIRGHQVLPEDKLYSPEATLAAASDLRADALFVVTVLKRKKVRESIFFPPPNMNYIEKEKYYGFYSTIPPNVRPKSPTEETLGFPYQYPPIGKTDETIYDDTESSLYDTATGKIVWIATAEIQLLGDNPVMVDSYTSQIVKSLQKQNIIR